MNPDYEIYSALKDEIPAEDVARLDGYLRGRSEASLKDEVERLKKALAELEAERE